MRLTGGGQFGQNGQKLHEKFTKLAFWGPKQWRGTWGDGDKLIFLGSRVGCPQSPILGKTLHIKMETPLPLN